MIYGIFLAYWGPNWSEYEENVLAINWSCLREGIRDFKGLVHKFALEVIP